MRVVIVGAGLSGLVAATRLSANGVDVTLVDKGRGPGGRLATRRLGAATIDHGAQFFTVRTPAFQHRVDDWVARGLAEVWCHGFAEHDGYPRYIATGGMNSLAKDLATGLDVRAPAMAFAVRPTVPGDTAGRWSVVIDDGTVLDADAVVITTPLPQSFALLADSELELDDSLMRTDYNRTITLLAVVDGHVAVEAPGAAQEPTPDIAFVSDNRSKGVSSQPSLTLHASSAWSEHHWDDDTEHLREMLLALASPWIDATQVTEAQVKKWRFAGPRTIWPDPCWTSPEGRVVLAGDAFAGPRIEGAHNSGLAAAHALVG